MGIPGTGSPRPLGGSRLRDERCFVELDPDSIDDYDNATTLSGAPEEGCQVGPEDVDAVDFVVSGSVAVTESGARIGTGEGYSDLEYAVLRELDLVEASTTVGTTVHELQVCKERWAVDEHDVPMDVLATPERVVETETEYDRPTDIGWNALDDDRIAEIPVLAARKH